MARARSRREEIERWFALREREGLSLRALSERSGIPAGTLAWWNHQVKKRPRRGRKSGFVKVVVGDSGVDRGSAGQGFRVVLTSGHAVEVPGDFDSGSLARLVETLRQC